MDNKSKLFKTLQAKWYAKIEKGGFEDIEQADGRLKLWASGVFKERLARKGPNFFEATEEYYRKAGHFLHEHKFESDFAKTVWEFHATGVSIREIVGRLRDKGVKTHRRRVHETLQGLKQLLLKSQGGSHD